LKNPVGGAGLGSGDGAWAGQGFGDKTALAYYDWKFGRLDQELGRWVYAKYEKIMHCMNLGKWNTVAVYQASGTLFTLEGLQPAFRGTAQAARSGGVWVSEWPFPERRHR
jgi:hypothetical protein